MKLTKMKRVMAGGAAGVLALGVMAGPAGAAGSESGNIRCSAPNGGPPLCTRPFGQTGMHTITFRTGGTLLTRRTVTRPVQLLSGIPTLLAVG